VGQKKWTISVGAKRGRVFEARERKTIIGGGQILLWNRDSFNCSRVEGGKWAIGEAEIYHNSYTHCRGVERGGKLISRVTT